MRKHSDHAANTKVLFTDDRLSLVILPLALADILEYLRFRMR